MKITQFEHTPSGTYSILVSLQPGIHVPKEMPDTAFIPFPPDTRMRVEDTMQFPFSTFGQVIMTFPNNVTYTGSGTLIGELYVLTCAHNLYSASDGGYARSVRFIPARNGVMDKPYGMFEASNFTVPQEYIHLNSDNPNATAGFVTDHTEYLYDYGLIQLAEPVEQAGSLNMYVAEEATLRNLEAIITGYPADKNPSDTMWGASGNLFEGVDEDLLYYTIPTSAGESGSAVCSPLPKVLPKTQPKIIGIHVGGSLSLRMNFAIRLTEQIVERIHSWM